MSTTDDLRGLLDALGDLGAVSPDVDLLADIVEGVINALIERESATVRVDGDPLWRGEGAPKPIDGRPILAEMTRDETADGLRADGFPGTTSSALGDALRRHADWLREQAGYNAPADDVAGFADQADALTAERDRLRDDYDRTAEAADRAAVRLREAEGERDEARAEAESAHEGRINALNRATAVEAHRDTLAAEVRHLHAVIAGDETVRGASWKRLRRDRDAAMAAVGRVRGLLDGRALVPSGLLREALDGELQPRSSGGEGAEGSTAGSLPPLAGAGTAEASPSGRGAARAVEGQASGFGAVGVDFRWSDDRRPGRPRVFGEGGVQR